jgi:hypothetical protein
MMRWRGEEENEGSKCITLDELSICRKNESIAQGSSNIGGLGDWCR